MPFYDSTSIQSLSVNYLFSEQPINILGNSIQRRVKYSKNLVECFITDSTGTFDLLHLSDTSSQNAIMIDKLLDYRLGNTITLDDITYEDLEYRLAKLIYVYLNLMTNGIMTDFDTTDSISSGNSLIDSLFEMYVLNESHKLVKTWQTFLESDALELRPTRQKFIIDQDLIDAGYILLTDQLPYDTDKMYLYKNGDLVDSSYYSFLSDSTSLTINIDSTGSSGLNIMESDVLILDSFVSVNLLDP